MSYKFCVSVLIPCFNKIHYVERAVRSVLTQKGIDGFEIIVVDDCSTDGSFQLLERIADQHAQVKIIKNEFNMGVSATRNRAIEEANGEYLCFLDADDEYSNLKLSAEFEAMEKHGAKAIAYSGVTEQTGGARFEYPNVEQFARLSASKQLYLASKLAMPGLRDWMFRKDQFGDVRFAEDINLWEEWEFLLRLMLRGGRMVYSGVMGTVYHRHGDGLSSQPDALHSLAVSKILRRNGAMLRRQLGLLYWLGICEHHFRCKFALRIKKRARAMLGLNLRITE